MPEPQALSGATALGRILEGVRRRGLDSIEPGPIDDDPRPDEPGHPEYHRRRRAAWALARWHTATPPLYQRAEATDPRVIAWAERAAPGLEHAGSLLLTGPTGTGKTHQAYGALRRIAAAGPRRFEMIGTTAADMYGLLRPGGSSRPSEDELARLCRIPLLLLDDLGSAKVTEWTEEVTYRLINERYNNLRPTLFTSNLPARAAVDAHGQPAGPDLSSRLGERIASRLAQMTTVVAMTGPDMRRAGGGAS